MKSDQPEPRPQAAAVFTGNLKFSIHWHGAAPSQLQVSKSAGVCHDLGWVRALQAPSLSLPGRACQCSGLLGSVSESA